MRQIYQQYLLIKGKTNDRRSLARAKRIDCPVKRMSQLRFSFIAEKSLS